ncbi:MAG: hypothetical protein Q8P92_03195 [Candidatus Daviesbacteria bacterium]|nr:hypothetical protein [Candidatus Daviesbacteria bacterium]
MLILWIILFLLILGISFALAYSSMKDYQLTPQANRIHEHGLYLIRNPSLFNINFLTNLHKILVEDKQIISFERLFKGGESALVVFGSQEFLKPLTDQLSLVELEDYSDINKNLVYAWEVDLKNEETFLQEPGDIFKDFPHLLPQEQFFWQVVIMAGNENEFRIQIRAVFVSNDSKRRKEIGEILQNFNPNMIKLPKDFSSIQILELYQKRSLSQEKAITLKTASIIKLLKL